MKRNALIFALLLTSVVGCDSPDKALRVSENAIAKSQSPPAKSQNHLKTLFGYEDLAGTLQSGQVWNQYESDRVAFQAPLEKGAAKIRIEDTQRMMASIRRKMTGTGKWPASLQGMPGRSPVSYASLTGDPEATLFAWAQANNQGNGSEDVYLEASAYAMLSGSSYSEDVSGDGSAVASVAFDPISAMNPYGKIHLYLNGVELAVINPQYGTAEGGMIVEHEYGTTTRYSGGTSGSGSRTITRPQFTQLNPNRINMFVARACAPLKPVGNLLLTAFLPAELQAQSNCNYYMRQALIHLAMMAASAAVDNPVGFFGSFMMVINDVHQYARCKERT